MNSLFEAFFRTIKGYKPGIKNLSIRLGKNEWWLYPLMDPEAWTRFPISLLIPLIETTKNPGLLEGIARELGYGLYKIPKKGISDAFRDATEFQNILLITATKYQQFYYSLLDKANPADRQEIEKARATTEEAMEAIKKGMAALAKAEHQVLKYQHRQKDLFDDNPENETGEDNE